MSVVIAPIVGQQLIRMVKESNDQLSERELMMIDRCHLLSIDTWMGVYNDNLVCAWGLIPPCILAEEAYLWLYTTEKIKECQFLFVRHSQIIVKKMLEDYPTIIGHVKTDSKDSKRWLKWLGAEFLPDHGSQLTPFRIKKIWPTQSA